MSALGQTLPLLCFFMVSLLGVSGLVLDLGNGYVQRRAVQNEADAAALAGVDAVPNGGYAAAAQQMAAKNGRPGDQVTVTFNGTDTVTVTVTRVAPTFMLKVFGKTSIPVSATAVARIEALAAVKGHVSPYAVTEDTYANGNGGGKPTGTGGGNGNAGRNGNPGGNGNGGGKPTAPGGGKPT